MRDDMLALNRCRCGERIEGVAAGHVTIEHGAAAATEKRRDVDHVAAEAGFEVDDPIEPIGAGCAVDAEPVGLRAAGKRVVTGHADERIGAFGTRKTVRGIVADDRVGFGVAAAVERGVAGEDEAFGVGRQRPRNAGADFVATLACQLDGAITCAVYKEAVVSDTAIHPVGTRTSVEAVVAGIAVKLIGQHGAEHYFVGLAAVDVRAAGLQREAGGVGQAACTGNNEAQVFSRGIGTLTYPSRSIEKTVPPLAT
jgi:hypothetical protein